MQVSPLILMDRVDSDGITPRGDRPLASCLGGGDLDGDDFNLILDVCQTFPPIIHV